MVMSSLQISSIVNQFILSLMNSTEKTIQSCIFERHLPPDIEDTLDHLYVVLSRFVQSTSGHMALA